NRITEMMMSTLGATLQTLAFLGAVVAVLLAGASAVVFVMLRRRTWATRAIMTGGLVASLYALTLLAFGVASPAVNIAPGERKVFCEVDCHVAYEITAGYKDSDTLVLSVRELFDENSVSSRRGDAPLHPGSRRFALVDSKGRQWEPVRIRTADTAPLFAVLRPGESHQAQLSFSVPQGVQIRGLLVEDDSPVSPLLIGHERSPFHQKALLSLPASIMRARATLGLSARARQE
ncbi:MAG: hypothetical protein ABIT36_01325, partial [Steroidobacteraceae bacterium]